ncbi:MAG TPA: DNA mismatch repair endonuclease MutL [Candidatus Cloacimonetes bacterium]|nr:DNA mismatch repair endonuclease MutL [Candidatus Cloacimonadota bacterium]HEX37846.1 DNA mismatch repair endonuclease MutL [Candidatus Cloacimonadota bacterium]
MSRIKILDEKIINHIAAGEIIERPASVVKELVENAIDANATKITVIVEDGGKKSIEVIDNGSGMTKEDALLSLERHATSKIYTLDDIQSISTLGFRGEAIPSIAAVSDLEIITLSQNKQDNTATLIQLHDGSIQNVSRTAGSPGTIIRVKNLFKNVPARQKFLKTTQTEMQHITRTIQHLACTHPEISFRLLHNKREILNYPKVEFLEKRIVEIFGDDFFRESVIPIQTTHEEIRLQGFIGSYHEDAAWQKIHYLYINERYINDKIIYSAIKKAYEPFTKKSLMKNQLPLYILLLEVPGNLIDVNVSPTKTEVRFQNSGMIFNFVKNSLTHALLDFERQKYAELQNTNDDTSVSANIKGKNEAIRHSNRPKIKPIENRSEQYLFGSKKKDVQLAYLFEDQIIKDKNKIIESEIVNPWQIDNSFISVEIKNGLLIVDQHAAHERILYEKIKQKLEDKNQVLEGQKLLFPLVIDLPKHLQKIIPDFIEQYQEMFLQVGFKIKVFSGNSIIVEEIPKDLSEWNKGDILIEIFKQIEEEFSPDGDFRDTLSKSYACHASIKVHQKLSKKEMLELINRLFACKNPFFCPHGRPTIIEITFEELKKRFKRI